MKKVDLGQTINTLANIGVIAGILFLALEVRQFQDQMEAQTNFNYYSAINSDMSQIIDSPYLPGIIEKVEIGEELTPEESIRARTWIVQILKLWEYGWREVEEGRYDIAVYNVDEKRNSFNGSLNALYRKTWQDLFESLDPGFVNFMEENVIKR